MAQSSELTSYALRVPAQVLKGHVIMGAIQITLGCLLVYSNTYMLLSADYSVSGRTFSGFWTSPIFIAAGATGLVGGRGRAGTQCCIVSCLVLSILAACLAVVAITFNVLVWLNWTLIATYADILWLLIFVFEMVVAIVQAVFACRAGCCCLPAEDRGGGSAHYMAQLAGSSATVESGLAPPAYRSC